MGKGSRVIYSSIVESFGVEYPVSNCLRNADCELLLTDLPFEVIRIIAAYLDSFRYISLLSSSILNGSVPLSTLRTVQLTSTQPKTSIQSYIIQD